jgi:peptidyl-prolyl cis-trans isomerase-like 2
LANQNIGTDKLYITHSEWSSDSAYSASQGAGVSRANPGDTTFKRLPYNYCALTLVEWKTPVCTASGTIYDLEAIVSSLAKQGANAKDPVTGGPLKRADLIELNFSKNADGDYADPVTGKIFTSNTHLVAIKSSGNVFAWETIERLNIKAKNWHDLVTDHEFGRRDLITLQDPMSIDGKGSTKATQEAEQTSTTDKIQKAKEAVAKAKAQRASGVDSKKLEASKSASTTLSKAATKGDSQSSRTGAIKQLPYNAAKHTTGMAAASFTSTYVTPHTAADRALLTDEEYMLKPKRVKQNGYVTFKTSLGDMSVELYPEYAPKAVWNFIRLAQKGYYRNQIFHRNIPNFMIQGGDPTGTGRGGSSIWGKNFSDEFDGKLVHDSRGILSMANKGKDTNSSQFFISYRATKHLDRKHTIFGKVVQGMDTLGKLEAVETDDKDKPLEDISLIDIVVLVDPFEEFLKQQEDKSRAAEEKEEVRRRGGAEEDRVTWTGKRIREDGTVEQTQRVGVGKYLAQALASKDKVERNQQDDEFSAEPARKKTKSGGFGNFDSW